MTEIDPESLTQGSSYYHFLLRSPKREFAIEHFKQYPWLIQVNLYTTTHNTGKHNVLYFCIDTFGVASSEMQRAVMPDYTPTWTLKATDNLMLGFSTQQQMRQTIEWLHANNYTIL